MKSWLERAVLRRARADLDSGMPVPRQDRLRVVHLVSTLNMGGLEKVVYDLVRCRDANAIDVRVLCLGEIGALADDFCELGISVESVGTLGKGILLSAAAVARRLRTWPVDILHTHNPAPHIVGALACCMLRSRVRLIHTKHGRNDPKDRRKIFYNRLAASLTDVIACVSRDAADVVLEIERVRREKVQVVHNGIDLSRFSAGAVLPRTDRPCGIHVARLVYPTKDQRSLLQAIRLVVDQVPTFRFLVVGDGPYRAELEQLRATLQLTENVELLGQRTDVSQLLAQSDFFVLSSLYEGLSLTLLEAAATGLPIVATRVGGNPEVVEHGVNGLLVPPKDPVKLAEAMVQLIRQPLQAGDMGRAGRAKMVEQFDLRRTVAKYETLYRQLAAN